MDRKFPLLINSFEGRDNFGVFLTELGFGKDQIAVEVGTHRGDFARTLLSSWSGYLKCVDHYPSNYDPEEIQETKGDRSNDFNVAIRTVAPYKDRVEFILKDSITGALSVPNDSLCFCYIDACHQYESTKIDLEVWWPKIKEGGVLAGHDIISTNGEGFDKGWGRYIQPAVFEFALKYDRIVYLVNGINTLPWSYYLIK